MWTAYGLWFIMPRHFDRTNYRKRRATDNTAPHTHACSQVDLSVIDQTIPSCVLWVNTSLEEAGYNVAFHMNITKPYSGQNFVIDTLFILILIWIKYMRQFRTDYKRVCP